MEMEDEEKNGLKKSKKKTYPMCMDYFEPEDLAVFGLANCEIQLY